MGVTFSKTYCIAPEQSVLYLESATERCRTLQGNGSAHVPVGRPLNLHINSGAFFNPYYVRDCGSVLSRTHSCRGRVMLDQRTASYGALLLRVSLGLLFLAHLYWKFFIRPGGLAGWWGVFPANGYPWFVPQ